MDSNEDLIGRVYAKWCGSGAEGEADIIELCRRLEQRIFIPPPLPEGSKTNANATVTYVGMSNLPDDQEWMTVS